MKKSFEHLIISTIRKLRNIFRLLSPSSAVKRRGIGSADEDVSGVPYNRSTKAIIALACVIILTILLHGVLALRIFYLEDMLSAEFGRSINAEDIKSIYIDESEITWTQLAVNADAFEIIARTEYIVTAPYEIKRVYAFLSAMPLQRYFFPRGSSMGPPLPTLRNPGPSPPGIFHHAYHYRIMIDVHGKGTKRVDISTDPDFPNISISREISVLGSTRVRWYRVMMSLDDFQEFHRLLRRTDAL
ncbi:MAG: hypothetical protein FWD98_06025 [Defluviitaleaceae bacterium]|nr:hypothetical protein [Defluviitaleaceae bacterium]